MCSECIFVFFFFKQKTAYEMRISDWSSDVCSSDLLDMPLESKFGALPKRASGQRPTAFLTVQEGCDKFCTYCVVPYTRGAEISRPFADLIAEARALVAGGVRDRKGGVEGKSVSVRLGLGGRRFHKKKKTHQT